MFNWISFLTYTMITTITPGPNTISSMSAASKKGFRKSLPFNFGVWFGVSVIMILCAVFCSMLSALVPKIKTPMLIVGALYILYLAWNTFRSGSILETHHHREGFLQAVLLQFLNIKLILYGIVSMETYILPSYYGNTAALLGFALLISTACFLSTLCWSAFGSVFRWLFSRHAKAVNTVMALLLVWCAVSLFLS